MSFFEVNEDRVAGFGGYSQAVRASIDVNSRVSKPDCYFSFWGFECDLVTLNETILEAWASSPADARMFREPDSAWLLGFNELV